MPRPARRGLNRRAGVSAPLAENGAKGQSALGERDEGRARQAAAVPRRDRRRPKRASVDPPDKAKCARVAREVDVHAKIKLLPRVDQGVLRQVGKDDIARRAENRRLLYFESRPAFDQRPFVAGGGRYMPIVDGDVVAALN